jgi:peptidoglycan/xylan/chitin deacetylase (PgdA/CDA1 family)
MKQYFIMTVDMDPPMLSMPDVKIEDGANALINLLDKYAIKAPFFVPSVVAEKFPAIMKEIVKQKHEIACHGLNHTTREALLNVNEQIRMIRTATEIIQLTTGLRPVGYRAPLFSINENCWKALQKNNYIYDSSVVGSPYYGSYKIFLKPFILPVPKMYENYGLLEIPVSVNPFMPLPLGGAYMRIFGPRWSKIGIKINFIFQRPVVFHIHPKDVIPSKYGHVWYRNRNTTNCMKMLEEIIKYVKQSGVRFLKAYELAELYLSGRVRPQKPKSYRIINTCALNH